MRRSRSGRTASLLALTLLGSGCGANPQASSPGFGGVAGQVSPSELEAPDMAGQWDIVSFEGHRPQRLNGTVRAAFADFDELGVRLRIECNYSGRAGKVAGGRFRPASKNDGMQTEMGCGAEREARDSRFFSFFNKSPTIERVRPDRVRLRAEGAELILERPALRRLGNIPTPAEMRGSWRLSEITRYQPGGGYTGSGLSEVPGRIVIADGRISYNRCPRYDLTFRMSEAGRLVKTGGGVPPAAPRECPELSAAPAAPMMPAPWDVLRLLHADPAIERAGEDVLLLSTDEIGLLITRAPCRSLDQSDDHRSSDDGNCASPS